MTITSDDPAALRQFETLLRTMSRHRSIVGRNYAVFLLRNAKAPEVAATLQQIFRTRCDVQRRGRYVQPQPLVPRLAAVVIVPDERLNAIVAYANRTDRAAIEGLLKVLDSADLPESLVAERLQIIPIENARGRDDRRESAGHVQDAARFAHGGRKQQLADRDRRPFDDEGSQARRSAGWTKPPAANPAGPWRSSPSASRTPSAWRAMLQTILKGQPAQRKPRTSRTRSSPTHAP